MRMDEREEHLHPQFDPLNLVHGGESVLSRTSSASVGCCYIHAVTEAPPALPDTACWYRGATSTRIQPTASVRLPSVLSRGLLQPASPKSEPSLAFLQLTEDLSGSRLQELLFR